MENLGYNAMTVLFAIIISITGATNKQDAPSESYTIETITDELANQLESLAKDDGSFKYGYNIKTKSETEGYNMIRHSHSVWALLEYYKNRGTLEEHKDVVKSGIDFIISNLAYRDSHTAYVKEISNDEIKLGALGIALVAICSYEDYFNDQEYIEFAKCIGNGILSMENPSGGYHHVLFQETLNVKNSFRTIYYDGEATFGLLKLYGLTKDSKYLKFAKKQMDFFINSNYEIKSDHWQEYAAYEMSIYDDDIKYLEYGIKNIESKFTTYSTKKRFANVDYERFLSGKKIYEKYYLKTGYSYLSPSFTLEDLNNELNKRYKEIIEDFNSTKNEVDININNVEKFFLINKDNSIRIDLIAHYINGLII